MINILIRAAKSEDLKIISDYMKEYELDTKDIKIEQFVVAEVLKNLAGFARIKKYQNIYEIASVGVVKEYRNLGIAREMIEYLITNCPSEKIWIVTKIPEYFSKLGFEKTDLAPTELVTKSNQVCSYYGKDKASTCFMFFRKVD